MNQSTKGLGVLAARGIAWRSAFSGLGKGVSFVGQWVLGYLLDPESFGVYATALSIAGIIGTLQDAGVEKYLLQDREKFESRVHASLQLSWWAAGLSGLLICLAGALWSLHLGNDRLFWVALPLALAAPIGATRPVWRARLASELRFKEAASVAFYSNVCRIVLSCTLAWAGGKALSLSIPWCAATLLEVVLLKRHCGVVPTGNVGEREPIRAMLKAAHWIVGARFFIGLINQGDYLVISAFVSATLVGAYFFGYSLIGSLTVLLGIGMKGVILPVLSRLSDDSRKRAEFFSQGTAAITVFTTPVFVAAAVVAGPVMDLMWGSKWALAVPVVQATSLSSAFLILSPIANAAMEALGLWRRAAILVALHAVTTLMAASIAAWSTDLALLASAVAVQHVFNIVLQFFVAARLLGLPFSRLLLVVVGPLLLTLPAWFLVEFLSARVGDVPLLFDIGFRLVVFAAVAGPIMFFCFRRTISAVGAMVARVPVRRPP